MTYFLVQLCSFTLSSKLLELVTEPQVRTNDHQLMVYFEVKLFKFDMADHVI